MGHAPPRLGGRLLSFQSPKLQLIQRKHLGRKVFQQSQ